MYNLYSDIIETFTNQSSLDTTQADSSKRPDVVVTRPQIQEPEQISKSLTSSYAPSTSQPSTSSYASSTSQPSTSSYASTSQPSTSYASTSQPSTSQPSTSQPSTSQPSNPSSNLPNNSLINNTSISQLTTIFDNNSTSKSSNTFLNFAQNTNTQITPIISPTSITNPKPSTLPFQTTTNVVKNVTNYKKSNSDLNFTQIMIISGGSIAAVVLIYIIIRYIFKVKSIR